MLSNRIPDFFVHPSLLLALALCFLSLLLLTIFKPPLSLHYHPLPSFLLPCTPHPFSCPSLSGLLSSRWSSLSDLPHFISPLCASPAVPPWSFSPLCPHSAAPSSVALCYSGDSSLLDLVHAYVYFSGYCDENRQGLRQSNGSSCCRSRIGIPNYTYAYFLKGLFFKTEVQKMQIALPFYQTVPRTQCFGVAQILRTCLYFPNCKKPKENETISLSKG